MARSSVDDMIEGWARGLGSGVRTAVDKTNQGSLENWSAPKPPPPPLEGNVTYLDAAKALRDAVKAKKGRRPTVETWRPVAGQALGLKRLFQTKWQAVLDAGVEAGLFFIDNDSYSYPVLVALDPEPEITEPEPVGVTADPKAEAKAEPDAPVDSGLPEGWVCPVTLPCGHTNHKGHGITEDDPKQVAARAEGFCCAAAQQAAADHARLNPGMSTQRVHLHVNWRVRGLTHPVPAGLRRTPERESGPGWPGLCCDPETGLYIGGLANDCRHYHKGKERCPVHAPKERA